MRHFPSAVQRMAAISPDDCAISTITAYELHTGVEKCAKPDKERAKVELLLGTVRQLPFETAAAREAGRIRAVLESKGQMIGPYDILLAGQALATSLILVTANTGEFTRVPGLTLENWLSS
jgi:tRNA(fMet)-specific endonuclease VapC